MCFVRLARRNRLAFRRRGSSALGRLVYGRATRALANYVENFTAFAALDLAFIATHQSGGWGPTIWILARILYLPLYLFGVIYARTIAWAISVIAILMMLVRLVWY